MWVILSVLEDPECAWVSYIAAQTRQMKLEISMDFHFFSWWIEILMLSCFALTYLQIILFTVENGTLSEWVVNTIILVFCSRTGADAWSLMFPSIPDKLQNLYNDGYKLVLSFLAPVWHTSTLYSPYPSPTKRISWEVLSSWECIW